MGIKGLSKVLQEHAPGSVSFHEMKQLFGRKVAIDASMSIYQFMVAVRSSAGPSGASAQLTNDKGEVTSHLQGLFYRTIRIVENGLKPCYVFDGKPPSMKSDELAKRSQRREEAENSLKLATEEQDTEKMDKFSRRLVKVTKEHNLECQRLLKLMGIPVVQAPCEAEAQCAELCKAGKVWATGTEDMDALTFGTNILLRKLTFSEARKEPIQKYDISKVLEALELSMEEFVDFCILLGCDYSGSIRGIGPKRALALIKKHKSIEQVLEHIDIKKNPVPDDFNYEEARKLFHAPEVTDGKTIELEWNDPDEEGLIQFLVNEKGFSMERIKSGIAKLKKSRKAGSQKRLDSFFIVKPSSPSSKKRSKSTKSTKKPSTKRGKR